MGRKSPSSAKRLYTTRFANVVPLRSTLLPRHHDYLNRWLEAGLCMGLCDAEIKTFENSVGADLVAHVFIWVRESADPAYILQPRGLGWALLDSIRGTELGYYRSFERALHRIRPVLPLTSSEAA